MSILRKVVGHASNGWPYVFQHLIQGTRPCVRLDSKPEHGQDSTAPYSKVTQPEPDEERLRTGKGTRNLAPIVPVNTTTTATITCPTAIAEVACRHESPTASMELATSQLATLVASDITTTRYNSMDSRFEAKVGQGPYTRCSILG